MSVTASQRIAVIGSGISGMAAGWYLSSQHEVTLFEADSRLGGHTATMDVEVNGVPYAIDTGFIVFNDWTYPHFQRLLATLGVPSQATEMSFSVHETDVDFEYNGMTLANGDDEIILSAGAIGTPHLLLLSGVGPAEQLARFDVPQVYDSPGVGKNLRDHPQARGRWRGSAGRPERRIWSMRSTAFAGRST